MSKSLNEHIKELDSLNKDVISLSSEILKAGSLFHIDILTMAVANRALELSEGFKEMVQSKKFLCAAPLLRLQVDNLLRYSAAWMVDKPHDFVQEVMSGVPIKKLKDSSGKNMADFYLVEKLSSEIPWIESVYKKTCGYVHFSESHFEKIMLSADDNGKVSMGIGNQSKAIDDSVYIEAVEAFNATTQEILKYMYGWLKTKDGSGGNI